MTTPNAASSATAFERVLQVPLGRRPRAASRRSIRRSSRPASAPPGSPAGSRAGGRPTSACSPATPSEVGSALALTAQRLRRRAGAGSAARSATRRAIRAVAVNSGNANASTGEQGYRDAVEMRDAAAEALGLEAAAVAIAETGTIGVPLDASAVVAGVREAAAALSASAAARSSRARS